MNKSELVKSIQNNGIKGMIVRFAYILSKPKKTIEVIKLKSSKIKDYPVFELNETIDKECLFKYKDETRILIQVHIYYVDLLNEIIDELNHFPFKYNLYISTTDNIRKEEIEKAIKDKVNAEDTVIEVFDNKGRDVYPFMKQVRNIYSNYDYLLHLHTKKSKDSKLGDDWRRYLYRGLLGSKDNIERIISCFETDKEIGIMYPETYGPLKSSIYYGYNTDNINRLANNLGIKRKYSDKDKRVMFPAGDMFWIRSKAIKRLLDYEIKETDIPEEKDQFDGTMMHAIERMWTNIIEADGYKTVVYKVTEK